MKQIMYFLSTLGSAFACLAMLGAAVAEPPSTPHARMEHFDRDPGWEGFRNRLLPPSPPITHQDFGYSADTNHVGGSKGEIGGRVQRSTTPAYYALPMPVKTFADKLRASGKFCVTQAAGGSGTLFGWFNDRAKGWRTANSLVLRLDGNGGKYWVFVEYGTRHWHAGGVGCFTGEHYQTTKTPPFLADGTVHEWTLEYDPRGANGNGAITFTLDGKTYTVNVRPEDRADGLEVNRFGILNTMIAGDSLEAWFDDLSVDGQKIDLRRDPEWDAKGNRVKFEDRVVRPFHDFGYSAGTNFAGGANKGEIGGVMWRDERPAFYAARTDKLTLDDELIASGSIAFNGAGSDSGVCFGWFDSECKQRQLEPPNQPAPKNVLAIVIEGPSRIGHYFRPCYFDSAGDGASKQDGPVIFPDSQVHAWSLRYDPDGANGKGRIYFKLDDTKQSFDLKPGAKQVGANFDRFGVFDLQTGGTYVNVYFDDLRFTASRAATRERRAAAVEP